MKICQLCLNNTVHGIRSEVRGVRQSLRTLMEAVPSNPYYKWAVKLEIGGKAIIHSTDY